MAMEIRESLLARRLKVLRDVNVTEGIVEAEVVDREPLDIRDPLPVGQGHGDLVVEISFENVRSSVFVGYDEALGAGPVGTTRPEEGVLAIAVVDEVLDEESELVDGVDLAVDLVVVGVEGGWGSREKR